MSQASQAWFQTELRKLLAKCVPPDNNVSSSLKQNVLFYSVVPIAFPVLLLDLPRTIPTGPPPCAIPSSDERGQTRRVLQRALHGKGGYGGFRGAGKPLRVCESCCAPPPFRPHPGCGGGSLLKIPHARTHAAHTRVHSIPMSGRAHIIRMLTRKKRACMHDT